MARVFVGNLAEDCSQEELKADVRCVAALGFVCILIFVATTSAFGHQDPMHGWILIFVLVICFMTYPGYLDASLCSYS